MAAGLRRWLQTLTGRRIGRIGARSYCAIDAQRPEDGWFWYDERLRSLLQQQAVDLAIDAGANEGQFGTRLRKIYRGALLSFEPLPTAAMSLREAAAGDAAWQVFEHALGSSETTAELQQTRLSTFSSLLPLSAYAQTRFGEEVRQTQRLNVAVHRLDTALAAIEHAQTRRIFLKTDTQGYDLEVYRGLGALEPRVVLLQNELSLLPVYDGAPHWTETAAIYEQAGFRIAGLFPVNHDRGRVVEYDALWLRDPAD